VAYEPFKMPSIEPLVTGSDIWYAVWDTARDVFLMVPLPSKIALICLMAFVMLCSSSRRMLAQILLRAAAESRI
jgi:hypothetical protein